MDNNYLYDKILGSLVCAGMGDALGAPSEALSATEIIKKFEGRIERFVDGSDNPYALGNRIAEVTDDTTQMYEMAKAMAKCKGAFTVKNAADALITWSEKYPCFYPASAGPTTKLVIEELKAGKDPVEVGLTSGIYSRGTTNGAAMRVAAAGLVHPGDWQQALEKAIIMCTPSHGCTRPAAATRIAAPFVVPREYIPDVIPTSTGSLPAFNSSITSFVVGPALAG